MIRAHLETKVSRVLKAFKVSKVKLDHKVRRVMLVRWGRLAQQVLKVQSA